MSGGDHGRSFAVFWPNNAHQPGVAPQQQQQQQLYDDGDDAFKARTTCPLVLKVVIKFRISSRIGSRSGHYQDFVAAHAIPQRTASVASCMGMASPYHHPHQDTPGTSGSEQVLHRNVRHHMCMHPTCVTTMTIILTATTSHNTHPVPHMSADVRVCCATCAKAQTQTKSCISRTRQSVRCLRSTR
jgi:hypothetical protein